jgi:hypothetical protein
MEQQSTASSDADHRGLRLEGLAPNKALIREAFVRRTRTIRQDIGTTDGACANAAREPAEEDDSRVIRGEIPVVECPPWNSYLRDFFEREDRGDDHAANKKFAAERCNLPSAEADVEKECHATDQDEVTDFVCAGQLLNKREEGPREMAVSEIDNRRHEEQPCASKQPAPQNSSPCFVSLAALCCAASAFTSARSDLNSHCSREVSSSL